MKKNIMSYMSMFAIVLFSGAGTLTSCSSDNEPFATATAGDMPKILNTDIPEGNNGEPGVLTTITRDANFNFTVIATPVDHTKVEWLLDGEKIAEGTTIDQSLPAGDYLLKIVATTTQGLQTSRTCRVVVRPLDGDPVLTDEALSRLVAAGMPANIAGENLDNVNKLIIGNVEITDVTVVGNALRFVVPTGLADGVYPVVMTDNNGTRYGGGKVKVSSEPFVNTGNFSANAGKDVTLHGVNLAGIKSVSVGDKAATIVSVSDTQVVFTCPELAPGEYQLTMTNEDGKPVNYNGQSTCTVVITAETTLWEGSFDVTWGTPFDALKTTFKDQTRAGATLRVYASREGQGTAATAW